MGHSQKNGLKLKNVAVKKWHTLKNVSQIKKGHI